MKKFSKILRKREREREGWVVQYCEGEVFQSPSIRELQSEKSSRPCREQGFHHRLPTRPQSNGVFGWSRTEEAQRWSPSPAAAQTGVSAETHHNIRIETTRCNTQSRKMQCQSGNVVHYLQVHITIIILVCTCICQVQGTEHPQIIFRSSLFTIKVQTLRLRGTAS